jgi:hypothetical protein
MKEWYTEECDSYPEAFASKQKQCYDIVSKIRVGKVNYATSEGIAALNRAM